MPRSFIMGPFPQAYTPLEEALVDAGIPPPISIPSSIVTNIAALIGAFVPETVASQPGFQPRDEDIASIGIPSSALFLIGSGLLSFTALGPGQLFLGINEPFVSNNSGSFQVTITPQQVIPEPPSLALWGIGIIGLFGCSWQRKGAGKRSPERLRSSIVAIDLFPNTQ